MNNNTFDKLQFDDLKSIVGDFCVSGLGRKLLTALNPSSNIDVVKKRLKETSEGVCILDMLGHTPLYAISNIDEVINKISKDIIIDASELVCVSEFLRGCRKFKKAMSDKEDYTNMLYGYSLCISNFVDIEEQINNAISGSVINSNATKELKKIRNQLDECENKIQERLKKFLSSTNNKKYIQEFFISQRNGRFTIPIKASYKNQVEGSVVEVSAKGSTVFIEPNIISKYVAKFNILKTEEAIEEYKILSMLSNLIYENIASIKINIECIAQFDMIFAKAKYSKSINGISPLINNIGYINIVKGKHPLLSKDAVKLDFTIGRGYRSLIITGPNAGGKTIVLKTVGILTLATMMGFHIEALDGSEISVFDNIFVDIGDNQSLENSLSTFSAHIKNLADILKLTNNKTLILSDEIGSGTEPREGASIAIAILEEFYQKGAITVGTTHYGEIKEFSEKHADFENAAMKFEKETLKPLYKLTIGKSGQSNALWISEKMGLNKSILERAKNYMNSTSYNYDLIKQTKVRVEKDIPTLDTLNIEYSKGDKIELLDFNSTAIIYEEEDKFSNLIVFYNDDFIKVNKNRIKLIFKAKQLYPEDYDLDSIFISYKERKREHDIQRGSKKALKKIQKEIKTSKFEQ